MRFSFLFFFIFIFFSISCTTQSSTQNPNMKVVQSVSKKVAHKKTSSSTKNNNSTLKSLGLLYSELELDEDNQRKLLKLNRASSDISWQPFSEVTLIKSRYNNKFIILYFYSDLCEACAAMDKNIFHNKNVARLINRNFTAIKMDVNDPITSEIFPQVNVIPFTVFAMPDSSILASAEGYIDKDTFEEVLNVIVKAADERARQEKNKKSKN